MDHPLRKIDRVSKGWEISGVHDPKVFFGSLRTLLADETILVLEEDSMVPEVSSFVQERAIAPQAEIRPGTLWPASRMHHLRLSLDVLQGLSAFSAKYAEPEICDHLYAYSGAQMLLDWHDAFSAPFYVSDHIAPTAVASFCAATGATAAPMSDL